MSIDVADRTVALPAGTDTDVCIVGAGIAGLSTAYELLLRGLRVVVLDDGPIGGGETARTTAHLANALDDRFVELARLHGEEGARLAAESHAEAITRIETIAAAEHIACDFRRVRGYLMQKAGDDPKALVVELTAARRAGIAGAQLVERAPIPGFDTGPALMFPDQAEISGRPNPWAKLYDPSRRTLRALVTFIKESSNTAAQYADWLTPGDGSVEDIPNHAGAVIRRGATKLAVYRDDHGVCHELSAVCPHLGGIVSWNKAESTWDCPCHGSRFDAFGRVIAGPAVDVLRAVTPP
ncbi:MAG: FAD-dependent oxidoreductase, partial [Myxococcales bacterium]|nr:FAD-dependent oxidoreductase [Myxococcales bacterium]